MNSDFKQQTWENFGTIILVLGVFFSILYNGLDLLEQRHQDFELQIFADRSRIILDQMTLNTEIENFWSKTLYADFKRAKGPGEFIEALNSHRTMTDEKLPCIVWNQNGEIVLNTHFNENKIKPDDLKQLYLDLKLVHSLGKKFPQDILDRLRKLLGPQLPPGKIPSSLYYQHLELIRPDSAGNFPNFWVRLGKDFSAMVFFDHNSLNPDAGLKEYFKTFAEPDIKIGLINSTNPKNLLQQSKLFKSQFLQMENEGLHAKIYGQHLLAARTISGKRILAVAKKYSPLVHPGKMALLLSLIMIFSFILFIRNFAASFRIEKFSVKWQLIMMLMITTGLPLITLGLIASDHISRQRGALIKNAYQNCVSFLQHVDQRSLVNNAVLINRTNQSVSEIKEMLPEKFGDKKVVNTIKKHIKKSFQDIRLVSSSPALLMTEFGVLGDKGFKYFKSKRQTEKGIMIELKVFRDIASYFISVQNKKPIDAEKFTETELLSEMAYQRPFHEIIQNLMLGTDKLVPLGWGEKPYPILVKLISLKNDKVIDYFYTVLFEKFFTQNEFLVRQADNLDRNSLGMKFTFANDRYFSKNNIEIDKDPWFNGIFRTTGTHPAPEPCFTRIDGKEHIYSGIKSQNLDLYYLFAFYPVDQILAQIEEEKKFLFGAGIIALLMLVGIALVFSSNFVIPLSALQTGALAIKERDFSFRLPELAHDEFGEMAKIFNRSMADFEELSLAGIVQARLFPQQGIFADEIEIYGKSVPMAELGGDYFDYFATDEQNFAVLAGDVAGHGVGASLIMAMAKAGVLNCKHLQHDPAAILGQLHQIVHESRTRVQRKVMTFQYLHINKETGAAVYANAGGCSPILLDKKEETAKELTLAGPVLGGFKKARFNNLEFSLAPGQALVFYTDGIIEAINSDGLEIGYERFKQMLLAAYDSDAMKFYEKVYSSYKSWLGDNPPQDDLTLIMLVKK